MTIHSQQLMLRFLLVLCLVALIACDRRPESQPKPPAEKPAAPPIAQDDSFRHKASGRIVAIGDVHGDLSATRRALKLARAIDDKDAWIGGNLVLVQTGDQLDRGDEEREILELFERLRKEAHKVGGDVKVLNGNHETMNVAGDFRYVTPAGFEVFRGGAAEDRTKKLSNYPESNRGRAAAFLPGGPWAKRLADHDIIVVVNQTVFVHGGVLPRHVRYGIGKINREARAWMRGESKAPPANLMNEDAPVWTRRYSQVPASSAECKLLTRALTALKADQMVVGHTVQKNGITSACEKRVWRIDSGMAKAYGGKPQVLEIEGKQVRTLGSAL